MQSNEIKCVWDRALIYILTVMYNSRLFVSFTCAANWIHEFALRIGTHTQKKIFLRAIKRIKVCGARSFMAETHSFHLYTIKQLHFAPFLPFNHHFISISFSLIINLISHQDHFHISLTFTQFSRPPTHHSLILFHKWGDRFARHTVKLSSHTKQLHALLIDNYLR